MNQIETLSMFTLCENDQLSNELHSGKFSSNGKLNAIHSNGSTPLEPTSDNDVNGANETEHCLDNATETEQRTMKSVTFVSDVEPYIPSIATYFCIIHDNQHRKMKNVQNLFSTVGPILIKLESLVLDTSTGELDNMRLYYNFWENQLFELLIRYFELLLLEKFSYTQCSQCVHLMHDLIPFECNVLGCWLLLFFHFCCFCLFAFRSHSCCLFLSLNSFLLTLLPLVLFLLMNITSCVPGTGDAPSIMRSPSVHICLGNRFFSSRLHFVLHVICVWMNLCA